MGCLCHFLTSDTNSTDQFQRDTESERIMRKMVDVPKLAVTTCRTCLVE